MRDKIKVVEVELSSPLKSFDGLRAYQQLWVLVRLHAEPLGLLKIPLFEDQVKAEELNSLILEKFKARLAGHPVANPVPSPVYQAQAISTSFDSFEPLFQADTAGPDRPESEPFITLAICTRNRTESLTRLLESVSKLSYSNFEVLVIDNAPDDNSTAKLIPEQYPQYRYIMEPSPGLNNARNRAIKEANGEIIAFTDDDTIVDSHWLAALGSAFETPDIMCVTGLVMPYELEHKAQLLFENYYGFTRGFDRQVVNLARRHPEKLWVFSAGVFGTGANMAFRRSLFEKIGLLDPALGAGTATLGGDDIAIYCRVLLEGYTLVYEPRALVWHIHRSEMKQLCRQLEGWGVGHSAYLTSILLQYPEMWGYVFIYSSYWLVNWVLRHVVRELLRPKRGMLVLALSEFKGAFKGPFAYLKTRRENKKRTSMVNSNVKSG